MLTFMFRMLTKFSDQLKRKNRVWVRKYDLNLSFSLTKATHELCVCAQNRHNLIPIYIGRRHPLLVFWLCLSIIAWCRTELMAMTSSGNMQL